MNLVNKVNEISSIDDKLEFVKNSITDENVNEASFIIKTPLVQQLILTIISKHKKGKELKEEVYKHIQKMLIVIMRNIEETLELDVIQDMKNTGIRSDLEAMHNEYDIERRFKNARRLLKD